MWRRVPDQWNEKFAAYDFLRSGILHLNRLRKSAKEHIVDLVSQKTRFLMGACGKWGKCGKAEREQANQKSYDYKLLQPLVHVYLPFNNHKLI
jgi:hypothetical protein